MESSTSYLPVMDTFATSVRGSVVGVLWECWVITVIGHFGSISRFIRANQENGVKWSVILGQGCHLHKVERFYCVIEDNANAFLSQQGG
jgi:hypothetical protein